MTTLARPDLQRQLERRLSLLLTKAYVEELCGRALVVCAEAAERRTEASLIRRGREATA